MPDTMLKLADGTCPLVATDIFTAADKTSVLTIDIANPTGFSQTVTVQLNGATLFSVSMPTMGGVSWHGPQVLEIGQKINLVASSASCYYNISGVDIT